MAEQEPRTEVYVIVTKYGVMNAGGTHSTPASFFLTEKGARESAARWHRDVDARVLRGTITWAEVHR